MKIITCSLITVILFLACKKHEDTPPPPYVSIFDGNVRIDRDTFDRFIITTTPAVAGDTTGMTISTIGFQRSSPYISDTNWLGQPLYERYARPGYLTIRYVGQDSLFNASNTGNLTGNIDYKLPHNLLGKMLFHGFSLYNGYSGDTVTHTYIYAASQNVHIIVKSSQTAPNATGQSIAAGYNYVLNKLDTSWFHIDRLTY